MKKFRLSTVAAIILALVAPATPASTATVGSEPMFRAQSASFSAAILDGVTNQSVEGSVRLERFLNEHQTEFVDGFSPYDTPNVSQPYVFSGLTDGDYLVVAENWETDHLSMNSYFELTVASGVVTAFHEEGQPSATVAQSSGVYQLDTFRANFYVQALNPDGTPFLSNHDANQRVRGELQRQDGASWVNEAWLDSYDVYDVNDAIIETGLKGRILDASAIYRVKLVPEGVAGVAESFSESFTITTVNQDPQALTPLRLDTPGMQVNVVAPGTTTPIGNSSVRLFNDDCCIDFSTWEANIPIAMVFESAGNFEIEVSTQDQNFSDLASKKYNIVVSEVAGKLVGVVTGETAVNGIYNLELSAANFSIKIVDPDDSSTPINNAQATIFEYVGGDRRDYVGDGWSQNGSVLSFRIEDGTYLVDVRPEDGNYLLASSSYLLTVSSSGNTVAVTTNEASPQAVTPNGDGVYLLAVAEANLVGSVVDVNNAAIATNWQQRKWVSVDLLKDNGDYYQHQGNTNVNEEGRFSFNLTTAGDYRVEIRPQGFENSANLSFDFTILEADLETTTTLEHPGTFAGKIVLPEPDLRIAVRAPGGSSNLSQVQLEVFRSGEYISNTQTSSSGIAALTLPSAGTYEIRVNPPRSAVGTARATYEAVLSISGDTPPVRTVTITGVTADAGIHILELGEPTLSGELTSPDGSQPIRDTEIIPVDRASGQEMWENSARTNAFGQFSIALPEGEWDIYARAPWGDTTMGDSDRIGPVVVNSSGVATSVPSGFTASAFDFSLNLPTWTGVMVSPNDSSQVLTNGNVCLATGNFETRTWTCAQTNSLGEWALSKPAGFNGFSEDDELFISEWGTRSFAERRLRGVSELESALGVWTTGLTYAGIELSPAAPNIRVFVSAGVDGNSDPLPARNAWVGIDDGMEWLGGGNTNAEGFASIAISDNKLTSELNVQVNVDHNAALSESYAGVRKVFSQDLSATAPRRLDVALAAPNLKVTVSEPGGSNTISYGWIEIMNDTTEEWVGGSNTNNSGFAAINLAANATYRVTVNPSWNGGSAFSKNTYTVVVDGSGAVTSVEDRLGANPTFDGSTNTYELELATPSLTGVVKDSSGNAVRDSWVTPIEQNGWEYLWWLGSNSRSTGDFAMNLDDGIYLLEANPSWNNVAGDTKSKRCSVEVASGALNSSYSGSDKCGISGGKVQLSLRAPNVVFTLKAPDGTTNVPYANVGLFLEGWNIWTQSDRNGLVALNLDADEILERSGLSSQQTRDIRIVVEPPYGNSDLARFECNSGDNIELCREIPDLVIDGSLVPSFSSALSTGFTAQFAAPNTKFQVADPDGNPLLERGSWVNVFAESGANRTWLSGGNSDGSGFVSFNLDLSDPTQTYTVEINPPHTKRGEFAQRTVTGLTHAQLNGSTLALLEPNLKLKIFDSNGTSAAKWAWVGVEVVDASNNNAYVSWVTGANTDRQGQVTLNLPNSKRYKIMLNPSTGTDGSFTSCLFDVDGTGTVTKVSGSCDLLATLSGDVWEIDLSAGNVVGQAFYDDVSNNPVYLGGVLIVATSGNEEVSTTSKADGSFALQLDSGTWTLEAFYVPKGGDEPAFTTSGYVISLGTVTASGTQQSLVAEFIR